MSMGTFVTATVTAAFGTDQFARHSLNGMKFSTPDNDNDETDSDNCAAELILTPDFKKG